MRRHEQGAHSQLPRRALAAASACNRLCKLWERNFTLGPLFLGLLLNRQPRQDPSERISLRPGGVPSAPTGDKAPRLQFRQVSLQGWGRDTGAFLDLAEGIRSFAYRAEH